MLPAEICALVRTEGWQARKVPRENPGRWWCNVAKGMLLRVGKNLHQYLLGTYKKCSFLCPNTDWPDQNLWRCGPGTFIPKKHINFWGLLLLCMKLVEPGRTCTWKLHMPICKACFSLEKCLFFTKCPFSTNSSQHFGARTLKDIIKLISSLKAYCAVSHTVIWLWLIRWSFFKYKVKCCPE